MAFSGLVKANNLSDIADKEKAWDNLGLAINYVYDPSIDFDADNYINAVEAADGASLEPEVKVAIFNFIIGCKFGGIWPAIKASCILAGARTLAGALVPLVGTAPTNFNFVSGDYNRKTGLVGDGSTKYLNSNRNNNADPQNNRHLSTWVSTAATGTEFGGDIGKYRDPASGNNYIGRAAGLTQVALSSPNLILAGLSSTVTSFRGVSRSVSGSLIYRASNTNNTVNTTSVTPLNSNVEVFRGGVSTLESNARLAFYSIGESLDLALLDTRVTALINAFVAALP